jgi:hypothetical protein
MDVISIAYIDREMASKDFGKKNIVTKEQKTINEVTNEARKIAFRSSAYVLDSKSRFPDIVDEVLLDATAFVEAIQDAINKAAERGIDVKPSTTKSVSKKSTKKPEPEPIIEEEEIEEDIIDEDEIPTDEMLFDEEEKTIEEEEDTLITLDEDRLEAIRATYKAADAGTKAEVKKYLANYGNKLSAEMMNSDVNAIEKILGINGEI